MPVDSWVVANAIADGMQSRLATRRPLRKAAAGLLPVLQLLLPDLLIPAVRRLGGRARPAPRLR